MNFKVYFLFLALALGAVHVEAQTETEYKWSGDIRYRINRGHESVDEERTKQQLRVRLGFETPVNEQFKATIRLATATSAISANQTLGDSKEPGMARRGFGLDLAFLDWSFVEFGNLWAGRTKNPFWTPSKVQTIFDSDLAFEGVALVFKRKWSESEVWLNVGGYIISENYSAPQDSVDTGIVGAELGYGIKNEAWALLAHVGYYDFLNIQNKAISTLDKGAKVDEYSYPYDRYAGNLVYPNDPFLPEDQRKYFFQNKYRLVELGLEWKLPLAGLNYTVFIEHVRNSAIGNQNKAFEYGLSLEMKPFSLSIAHIKKESDAVVGAFTDSDSNFGGTDNSGDRIQFGYSISKDASSGISYFLGDRGLNSVERKFTLAMVDLSLKF